MIWIILLSGISGVLYRLGGKTGYNTKIRDLGCPLIALAALWLLDGLKSSYWWAYLLTYGLMFGALTAYWRLDEKRFGYWAHGLGISLAIAPFCLISGLWWGFLIRTIVLTTFITLWSEYTKWDDLEEFGRGVGIVATLPLLLL